MPSQNDAPNILWGVVQYLQHQSSRNYDFFFCYGLCSKGRSFEVREYLRTINVNFLNAKKTYEVVKNMERHYDAPLLSLERQQLK